jgi:hypothetical protein
MDDPLVVTEINAVLKLIRDLGAVGGWGLMVFFLYGLGTKRVAWWYQVQDERDRIAKLEERIRQLEIQLESYRAPRART